MTFKRLFFGWQVDAPWPQKLPEGRVLDEEQRHVSLAFLGSCDFERIKSLLPSFPLPSFFLASIGIGDHLLFLPKNHARVVALHIDWITQDNEMRKYHSQVTHWLQDHGIKRDEREQWLAHVTVARSPFHQEEWKEQFTPLPLVAHTLHLYESVGNLHYFPLWSKPLLLPFEEFEHQADRAFVVRGINYNQLFTHAAFALAFVFPSLLKFIHPISQIAHLEEVIYELNQVILRADQEIGSPFKAVSYHSKQHFEKGMMEWEMIVDV